jgi:ataxia telangiectasia mutated family protein
MQLDENENEGEHEKYERPRIERVNGEMAAAMDKNENDAATRTISRINEKLQGYEDGTMGERQTVESQVRHLIARARDRDNLSQIFHGWSPWL